MRIAYKAVFPGPLRPGWMQRFPAASITIQQRKNVAAFPLTTSDCRHRFQDASKGRSPSITIRRRRMYVAEERLKAASAIHFWP